MPLGKGMIRKKLKGVINLVWSSIQIISESKKKDLEFSGGACRRIRSGSHRGYVPVGKKFLS